MRKIFLSLILVFCISDNTYAAPGDTTWVQAQTDTWLDWYNNFDTSVTFPNGSVQYRKIYMVFTLGKYVCPGNPQYCADWDYTVQTLWMTPGGDTVELGRLITPYANSLRMTAAWKGTYIFDVTDYYPLLKNQGTVRVHYAGYSGGFTANIRFAFIEGTPPRDVAGITAIWKGGYNYGHGSTPINTALGNVVLTAPADAVSAEAKFTITGHGGDSQNCAEFCPNSYTMNLNNAQLVQQNFWNDQCGYNNYYPQNGTWIYNRGGWCPGDLVKPYSHTLTNISANDNYTLNVNFPAYTSTPSSSGSQASYIIEAAVVYYKGFNKTLDASLEDIIAPTDFEAHFRKNPLVGKPVIKVSNTGSSTITSLKIAYGVSGTTPEEYTWTGNLAALAATEIELPESASLRAATGINTFVATILEVNGQADEDITNNELTAVFTAAPVWETQFRVVLKTNGSVSGGASETAWRIYDVNNNIVAQRTGNTPNTTFTDTVVLDPAVYRFEMTDAGCDGINWWAYQFYNPNPGTGYVQVRRLSTGAAFPLKGYYNGDFGCGFSQYFTTAWPTAVTTPHSQGKAMLEIYPNPAKEVATLQFSGIREIKGAIRVIDPAGRIVKTQATDKAMEMIDIAALAGGMYLVVYEDAATGNRLHTRLIIAK